MSTAELVPVEHVENFHLVARNPMEMASAQADLALWLQKKVAAFDSEISELASALAVAKQNKWATSTLASQLNKAKGRHRFYGKTLLAVQMGFTIVPNFPIDVFAIRTSKAHPKHQYAQSTWTPTVSDEKPQTLEAGEGRYQSPAQLCSTGETQVKNSKGELVPTRYIRTEDFTDVAFPIIAARPEVMTTTAAAMAAKVFDQIGICPQSKKGDPLIIGQILERNHFSAKMVSFLIAWHLDLRIL